LDQEVTALPPREEPQPSWRLDLFAGVLPTGVAFKSRTVLGDREIKRGPMPVVRLQGAAEIGAQLYLQLAGEFATSSDIRIYSFGADFGVRANLGSWGDAKFHFRGEAGLYYSQLDPVDSAFGDFKPAIMARVGAAVGAQVSENLWAELLIDFRFAEYSFKQEVLFHDKRTAGWGGAAMLGLSWRF
jgi:hypothetical protein